MNFNLVVFVQTNRQTESDTNCTGGLKNDDSDKSYCHKYMELLQGPFLPDQRSKQSMHCYIITVMLHNLMFTLEATNFHQHGKAKSQAYTSKRNTHSGTSCPQFVYQIC